MPSVVLALLLILSLPASALAACYLQRGGTLVDPILYGSMLGRKPLDDSFLPGKTVG